MYVTSYKLNNSYTTYVIHDYEGCDHETYSRPKTRKPLEWKCGAKVSHSFHGEGVIRGISDNKITVYFKQSKIYRQLKNVQIQFEYKVQPSDVESLRLCY